MKNKIYLLVLSLFLFITIPYFTKANYFTLPVNINPESHTTAYFDHDNDVSEEVYYDGTSDHDYDNHNGTDFATSTGVAVLAPADGVV